MTRPEKRQSIRHEAASQSGRSRVRRRATGVRSAEGLERSRQRLDAEPNLTTATGEPSRCTPSSWYLRMR